MFIFCWFTMNNGFSWLMFAPVTHKVMHFYAPWVDHTEVELLNSWQPFVYLLAVLPIMKMISSHDGLRKSVKFGVTCELVGALLKLWSVWIQHDWLALILINLGQIMSALASPVSIGAPSALSATWYDADERTRATAAAVLFNNVGNALSYTLVPTLTTMFGFQYVVYFECVMATCTFVLAFLKFPSVPDTIHLHTTPSRPLATQLKEMATNKSVVLLFLVYCWSSGAFVGWQSMFDAMYDDYFGAVFMGQVAFIGTVGYVFGGLISSFLTDFYFRRNMKMVIVVSCGLNVLACIGFLMMMPGSATRTIESYDSRGKMYSTADPNAIQLDWGRPWILVMAGLCGLFNGSAAPIFYELVAEISYPVEEGISGNVISMCENVGSLFIYQVVARFVTLRQINVVFTTGMFIVTVLGAMVKEQYLRMDAFEAARTVMEIREEDALSEEEERHRHEGEEGAAAAEDLRETTKLLSIHGDYGASHRSHRLSMEELDVYGLAQGGSPRLVPPDVRCSLHQSFRGSFVGARGTYGPAPRMSSIGTQVASVAKVKQFSYGAA